MTQQELVFSLAFMNLGGGFLLALWLRYQAVRALEKETTTAPQGTAVALREATNEA